MQSSPRKHLPTRLRAAPPGPPGRLWDSRFPPPAPSSGSPVRFRDWPTQVQAAESAKRGRGAGAQVHTMTGHLAGGLRSNYGGGHRLSRGGWGVTVGPGQFSPWPRPPELPPFSWSSWRQGLCPGLRLLPHHHDHVHVWSGSRINVRHLWPRFRNRDGPSRKTSIRPLMKHTCC